MLATGTATISEVANRLVAERPEAKEADATGGRFAGLMAHWIQPQTMAKPPEKAPGEGLKAVHQKATKSKPATGAPSAMADAPPAPDEARSALKSGSPAAPKPPAAPARRSPSAPAAADDSAASARDAAASVSDSAVVPSDSVLPAGVGGLPVSASLVPAQDPALAILAAQALSALQAGLPGGPVPSAPAPFPQGTVSLKGAPATLDPIQAPVPPQAITPPQAATPTQAITPSQAITPTLATAPPEATTTTLAPAPPQATTNTQALLAEDLSKTKVKAMTRDLQAALEALETTPPMADPVAVKAGLNLAAAPAPQEAPAMAPTKAGPVVPPSGQNFESSQVDSGANKALPFTYGMEGVPVEAAPAPVPATALQHTDSNAMAALTAQPRTLTPAAGTAPTAPLPNTPAQPGSVASPLVTQVAGGVRWMLQGGSQEAQLQLHPDSLGQVTIHLRVQGGEVHARLWVSEAASVQAVQEGRPHLEASLKEQGLQLGSFDLQQGQRPFQEAPATPAYPGRPVLDLVPAGQEAPVPPVAAILNSRHVELYA